MSASDDELKLQRQKELDDIHQKIATADNLLERMTNELREKQIKYDEFKRQQELLKSQNIKEIQELDEVNDGFKLQVQQKEEQKKALEGRLKKYNVQTLEKQLDELQLKGGTEENLRLKQENFDELMHDLKTILRQQVMYARLDHECRMLTYTSKLHILYNNYYELIEISKNEEFKKEAVSYRKSIETYLKVEKEIAKLYEDIDKEVVDKEAMAKDDYIETCNKYLEIVQKEIERILAQPPMVDLETVLTLIDSQLASDNIILQDRINNIMHIVHLKIADATHAQLVDYIKAISDGDVQKGLEDLSDAEIADLFIEQYS